MAAPVAAMPDENLVVLLRECVADWNRLLKRLNRDAIDLSGANLTQAKLRMADLSGTGASKLNLTKMLPRVPMLDHPVNYLMLSLQLAQAAHSVTIDHARLSR
jgi:uncharacterized protein YjbI with pentapeptide repeats